MAKTITREGYLTLGISHMAPMFASQGANLPSQLRVTCGWPQTAARARKAKAIGEIWGPEFSRDGSFEIFISPIIDDPVEALAILAHELCHAAVGIEVGHRRPFAILAHAIGLAGKPTATTPGEAFRQAVAPFIARMKEKGGYAHAAIEDTDGVLSSGAKKQGTRLVKCECPTCGYNVRMSQKWINDVGAAHCPAHGEMAVV